MITFCSAGDDHNHRGSRCAENNNQSSVAVAVADDANTNQSSVAVFVMMRINHQSLPW